MKLWAIALAVAALLAGANVGEAQQKRDVAGRFDYYILALSWSPSFCAAPGADAREPRQCGADRRFAFVVHGLWPQYERGWPRACAANQPRDVAQPLAASMLDLMPSPQLIQNQWDRHGTCSGLAPQPYFALTRDFRRRVVIPPAFVAPQSALRVSAAEVEAAFAKANPGLSGAKIAVSCARNRLREVRICFTKAGQFRSCGADVQDACEGRVAMPPVRLGMRSDGARASGH